MRKNRQKKNSHTVKKRWYGRDTSVSKKLVGGKRNAEYNIELLKPVKTLTKKHRKYAVIESWGVIGRPSTVGIVMFRSKKKAEAFFQKEVEASMSRGYKETKKRTIRGD